MRNDYLKGFELRTVTLIGTIQRLVRGIGYVQDAKYAKKQCKSDKIAARKSTMEEISLNPSKTRARMAAVIRNQLQNPDLGIDLVKPIYTGMKWFELIFIEKQLSIMSAVTEQNLCRRNMLVEIQYTQPGSQGRACKKIYPLQPQVKTHKGISGCLTRPL